MIRCEPDKMQHSQSDESLLKDMRLVINASDQVLSSTIDARTKPERYEMKRLLSHLPVVLEAQGKRGHSRPQPGEARAGGPPLSARLSGNSAAIAAAAAAAAGTPAPVAATPRQSTPMAAPPRSARGVRRSQQSQRQQLATPQLAAAGGTPRGGPASSPFAAVRSPGSARQAHSAPRRRAQTPAAGPPAPASPARPPSAAPSVGSAFGGAFGGAGGAAGAGVGGGFGGGGGGGGLGAAAGAAAMWAAARAPASPAAAAVAAATQEEAASPRPGSSPQWQQHPRASRGFAAPGASAGVSGGGGAAAFDAESADGGFEAWATSMSGGSGEAPRYVQRLGELGIDPRGMKAADILRMLYARGANTTSKAMSEEAQRSLNARPVTPRAFKSVLTHRANQEIREARDEHQSNVHRHLDKWEIETLADMCRGITYHQTQTKGSHSEYTGSYSKKWKTDMPARKPYVRQPV